MANKKIIKLDIINAVNNIFLAAIKKGASDIHIEPHEDEMIIRYRVDGVLSVVETGNLDTFKQIISRIKVLAQLETMGRQRPQEGKYKFSFQDAEADLRISIFPTSLGETVVIRILESIKIFKKYDDLGFTPEQSKTIENTTEKPYGLILVTGPNGAGKSTTLFTILNKLNKPGKSLVTLEDPVEMKLDMVRQTQIDPDINLTFASGLRYLLRQDPDIIMVGEIRDKETAQIAVQASITGHLVLATVHTNNAAGAIVRMINMKVEPFLLASALKLVTAQRLALVNCPKCKKEYFPSQELLAKFRNSKNMKFYHSSGCNYCNNKGIKGRVGMHEVLVINDEIKNIIHSKPDDKEITKIAERDGMISLREAALKKVNEGVITIEEALRLTE